MLEHFIDEIIKYNPNTDLSLIEKAYNIAEKYHAGQLRKSGEEYFIHPVEVAKILIELEMDDATIIAGLLHDVLEDTDYTYEQLKNDFGDEIAMLVEGVTKLGTLVYESKEERQAENLRKMFLAMSKDIRVLIIKLADRLHNMRTINYMDERKIREKCLETIEIYAPLAHRLGISKIKWELEDISFRYLEPHAYYDLYEKVKKKRSERENIINEVIEELKSEIKLHNISFEITGRSKHFYSIYKKMKYQNKEFDEIFDLMAVRIIVDSIRDCYAVLGIVHTMWKPIPGRFKDYIAMPKPNMYQSIHTTVIGKNGDPFEIQIRTLEMHKIAEYGIAAHWKYKEGKQNNSEFDNKLSWLRQMMEWQRELKDPKEFMESLKVDLFSNQVFVFTPKGEVIELPMGSTPIDFAYKIHSEVGNKCIGSRVNGKMVPLDYKLNNGNIVEIITSANSKGPSIDWLKIVKSTQAKNKIKNWLKKEDKSDNIDKGREILEKYVRRKGYDSQQIIRPQWINKAAKHFNLTSSEHLYASIGNGSIMVNKVVPMLQEYYRIEKQQELIQNEKSSADVQPTKQKRKKKEASGIKVKGVDNLLIRMSKCCNPVPGDEIVGFITKGRGLSIHRRDCINIISEYDSIKNRLIEVEWDTDKEDISYETDISILAEDRKGILVDVTRVFDDLNMTVTGIMAKSGKDSIVTINLTIEITNIDQLEKVFTKIKNLQGVVDVFRAIS
ncbi:MAG: bifunctional (p)ppGpp synthetase/guanosine-3',5'-bis(diphosphate) 3'-pyrophosphohydrolase [Clostridiales bacterium]|nr:bifunctional (p)ppGpp synthetase/guanosine-3',5'-bis(diphosphate) 3'-pyrophosphohydrolase [Clostridiales bacterium]